MRSARSQPRRSRCGRRRFRAVIVCGCLDTALVHPASPILPACGSPVEKQQIPHLPLRPVKLRLGVADGAVQQLGDLVMLVPLNCMKTKDLSATCREFADRPAEEDTVDDTREIRIILSKVAPQRWRLERHGLVK